MELYAILTVPDATKQEANDLAARLVKSGAAVEAEAHRFWSDNAEENAKDAKSMLRTKRNVSVFVTAETERAVQILLEYARITGGPEAKFSRTYRLQGDIYQKVAK